MASYNRQTARGLARRIYDRLGLRIAQATKGTNVKQEWLAGFFGVENAQLNSKATRFEAAHYAALQSLRDNGYFIRRGRRLTVFNGIRQSQIRDANDEALRALAKSYGLAQIMGWHTINNLHDIDGSQMTVSDLTDKNEELFYIVQLMEITAGTYLRRGDFGNVLHIWNTGHAIQNGRIETYDPNYIPNARLVGEEYLKLIRAVPFDDEANDDDEQAAREHDINFIANAQGDDAGGANTPQAAEETGGLPVPPSSASVPEKTDDSRVTVQKVAQSLGSKIMAGGLPTGGIFSALALAVLGALKNPIVIGAIIVASILIGAFLWDRSKQRQAMLQAKLVDKAADKDAATVEIKPPATEAA